MSTLALTRLRAVAPLAESLTALWRGVAERLARRAAYRRTLAELSALGDHELNDLGISRWDVEAVARRSVYGS